MLKRIDRTIADELGVDSLAEARISDQQLGDRIIRAVWAELPSLPGPVQQQVLVQAKVPAPK